jgi:hypothetical protein
MDDPLVNYTYSTRYNFRPQECYGMGKESLMITGTGKLSDFLRVIQTNSSMKHKNNLMYILGSDDVIEMEEWNPWIGQPMFTLYDIKFEVIDNV